MLECFTDPVLRAPTIGCMLMCFASGLIGSVVFAQRRSLVGEALAHAAYPGIVLSVFIAPFLFATGEVPFGLTVLVGAFVSSLLGLFLIGWLEQHLNISSDAALCFVLSIFFGIGVLIASRIQMTHTSAFRQMQCYLFGQAATMVDTHLYLYGSLALAVAATFILLYRYLELLHFDRPFAQCMGMPTRRIEWGLHLLLVLAVVVGMRSVGVVLMSAMLIAPPIAARWWAERFSHVLILSGLIGLASGFVGNLLSIRMGGSVALPTGPMIVLCAATFSVLSLVFSPKRGVVPRLFRMAQFTLRCMQENCLKALYKGQMYQTPPLIAFLMRRKGWIVEGKLTPEGLRVAENLIRLHRLWEVYLVHMGQSIERVHHSAEQMEHVLTPAMERELSMLLDDPTEDPHLQPIPQGSGP